MKKVSRNPQWSLAHQLEIRWWRRYLDKKDKKTYYAWKRDYWSNFLSKTIEHLTPSPGMKVLDAGSGPAGIFTILHDQQVTAIDPLFESYRKQLPHFDPDDFPYVNFVNSSLEDFQSAFQFDVVFCLNVINHVRHLESFIEALSNSIIKEGFLVLSVDAHRYKLLKHIFQLFPADALHPHQQLLDHYLQLLERNGLIIQHKELLKQEAIFGYWLIIAKKEVTITS